MAFLLIPTRIEHEPVTVTETHYQYFPASFVRRGQRMAVSAVRRCWTSIRRDLAGRPSEHHHFRVQTAEGTFVLTHDLRRDRWMLEPDIDQESRAAA